MRVDRRAVQLPRDTMSCPRRSAFCARRVIGGALQPNAATGGSPKRHVQPRCAECVPRQPAANATPARPARSAAQSVREAWLFTRRLLYLRQWHGDELRFDTHNGALFPCLHVAWRSLSLRTGVFSVGDDMGVPRPAAGHAAFRVGYLMFL